MVSAETVSNLTSIALVLLNFFILGIYIIQSRQRKQELEEQRRHLEAQKEQLKKQDQELEQYERELTELERQTQLAEIDYAAHLEVEEYSFENDNVVLQISNYGNGPAKNLQLKTNLDISGLDHLETTSACSPLRRRDNSNNEPNMGQAIRSEEQGVEFEGRANVGLEGVTGEEYQQSLRGLLMDLQEENINNQPKVTFEVVAETMIEEEYVQPVSDRPIPFDIPDDDTPINLSVLVKRHLLF